jgi:hypothetical protein
MPLARYFLFVGGTLLALLFALNAYIPSPVVARAPVETIDRPVVRIHSAQKLPERIVIDTSIATIIPPVVVAEVTAKPQKPQVLDALAQATPSDIKKSDLKKPEPALPPKHKVARRQVHQPMVASAQQPRFAFAQGPRFDFDFFGRN